MKPFALAMLLLALASGCSGGGGSAAPSGDAFVQAQFDATSEQSDPVPVNDLQLQFSEDPHAFDDLLQ